MDNDKDIELGILPDEKKTKFDDPQAQLAISLRQRNKESFERLLKLGKVDPNYVYTSLYNKTCLDSACSTTGMSEYVEILLENHADINRKNKKHDKAPIHFAAENCDIDTVRVLVNYEGINKLDINKLALDNTALNLVIKKIKDLKDDRDIKIKRYEEMVKLLVEAGTDVKIADKKLHTPMHSAAEQGLKAIIKIILDYSKKPVDLETPNVCLDDKTAKMIIEEKFPDLLQHPNIASESKPIDEHLLTAYLAAGEEEQFALNLNTIRKEDDLKRILDYNDGSYTFIQWTCKKGSDKAVKMLLDKGADPNLTATEHPITPIAYACRGGYHRILKLLEANKTIKFDAVDGESLLHFTIKGEEKIEENANVDYKKCLQILLKSDKANIDINYKDAIGNTALHYAIESGDQDVVMELLKNGAYLGIKNKFGEPPLSDISPKTLKSYLDSCLKTNGERINSDNYEIQFDYSFLKPPTNKGEQNSSDAPLISKNNSLAPETDVLLYMSKHPNLKSLLKHPVITSFLYMKWTRISSIFWILLILYILFLLSLNLYIYFGAEEYNKTVILGVLMPVWISLTIIGIILLTITKIILCYVSLKENWGSIKILLELITIIFFICYLICITFNIYLSKQLHALAILFTSAELVLLVGHFTELSTYIVMLKTVSWNFLKILLWYCILIIAFALSFHTSFNDESKPFDNKTNINFNPNKTEEKDKNKFFLHPGMSLFKTIIMLTGELEASDIDFKQSYINYFIFILFVFMIPIVLFNLLNGLAVSDTQAIKDNAELVSIISRIQLISYFEFILLGDTRPYTNAVASAQNRCCWLSGHSCKSWLAEKICLFPTYLPIAQISIKVNKRCKIEITPEKPKNTVNPGNPENTENPKNPENQKKNNDAKVEKGQSCLSRCLKLKMDYEIVKSAKSIITFKKDEGDSDINNLYVKLEELSKEVSNLSRRN